MPPTGFMLALAATLMTQTAIAATPPTPEEFARTIRTSRQNVNRWALGQGRPRPTDMRRISEATAGAVTANDFFGMTSQEAA